MFNVGNRVRMVNCREAKIYKGKTWEVRSEPWKCGDTIVVLLKGKSGGFDVRCLEQI